MSPKVLHRFAQRSTHGSIGSAANLGYSFRTVATTCPPSSWPQALRGAGRATKPGAAPRGLIVGYQPRASENIWLKDVDVPPFAFEDRPLVVGVTPRRQSPRSEPERVQVQVQAGAAPLATVNVTFAPGRLQTQAQTTLAPLPRGQHLLTLKALPTAGETALWDNEAHAQTEVMPNTVGVLHLLGSPSWDGRFLRRYLKGEPKYDLISFFILRDPWDSQQVNERELSLIPFPVERLFREELRTFASSSSKTLRSFSSCSPSIRITSSNSCKKAADCSLSADRGHSPPQT